MYIIKFYIKLINVWLTYFIRNNALGVDDEQGRSGNEGSMQGGSQAWDR
jgi:hypothetical protein